MPGKPILNILLLKNLTNIVALTIRYKIEGKLGIGLLARTYSNTINETLKLATLTEYEKTNTLTFEVKVNNDKWIMQLVSSINLPINSYSKDYFDNSFKYCLNNINLSTQQKIQILQTKNIIKTLAIL